MKLHNNLVIWRHIYTCKEGNTMYLNCTLNSLKPSQCENMRALPLGVQSDCTRETDTHTYTHASDISSW